MNRYIDAIYIAKQIADFKKSITSPNSDYMTGYICALSVTEGIIANQLLKQSTADVVEVVRKPVKGYEGYYEVDQFGRVYSIDRLIPVDDNGRQYNKVLGGKQMKQGMHSKGYKIVSLTKEGKSRLEKIKVHEFDIPDLLEPLFKRYH